MPTKLLWLALLVMTALTIGCGKSDHALKTKGDEPRDQIAAVIDQLGKAARDDDGARICKELFTSNLRISVARASGTTCAKEVGDNLFSPETAFDVKSVEVDGATATATVTDQRDRTSHLVLESEDGAWRIARIG